MPALKTLSYNRAQEFSFHQQLMQRASAYLAQKQDHKFADFSVFWRIILLSVLAIAGYCLVLTQDSIVLFALGFCLFFFCSMLMNLTGHHDSTHSALFRKRWMNRCFSRLVTLPLGVDPDYWRVRHTQFHHVYPNIEPYDLDMEENGILRQSPYQEWKPHMRYQLWYWPLVAALSLPYIAWVFDWSDRLGKTQLKYTSVLRGVSGWVVFISFKLLHLIIALVLPIYFASAHGISTGTVVLIYCLAQMLCSLVVVLLLLGTHWAEAKFYQLPEGGKMSIGWYALNFNTTCDWHLPRWAYPWLGGINLHLTHHLFPNWSYRHYPALAKIIGELAREQHMPYRYLSQRELFQSQRRFLTAMAQRNDASSKG
ncbi:acyl-CoA desaturase [Pseudomonas sp. F1_0610]|uniref:fatty acid desaturase family protein n=1 Tax=Pseudomonas sp. F1_0610 TaxID=3114284 RepID=UPI0039C1B7D4